MKCSFCKQEIIIPDYVKTLMRSTQEMVKTKEIMKHYKENHNDLILLVKFFIEDPS